MNRVSRLGLALLAAWLAAAAQAQGLPITDVWLAAMDAGVPGTPRRISATGRYNNQPLFARDGSAIFFTAEQADGQTDIERFEIATGQRTRVAPSPESEYSPTPMPGQPALSVVRVEADGRQRLWRIDLASGAFSLLLPNVEPVGYHTWFAEDAVAMFILGERFTLQSAVVGDGHAEFVWDSIGRTLRRHPQTGEVLFVDKNAEPWTIRAIDVDSGASKAVMPLFPGHEDFEVDREGRYWMGSGSKLYRSNAENSHWRLAADLSEYGIRNITRLGISSDGSLLAIVGSP